MLDVYATNDEKKPYELTINGVPVPENTGGVGRVGLSDTYRAMIVDTKLSDQIMTFRFCDITENIENIQIRPSSDMFENLHELKSIDFITIERAEDGVYAKIEFSFDISNWKYPWSITEFNDKLSDLVKSQYMPDLQLKLLGDALPTFELILEIENPQLQISTAGGVAASILQEL